MNSLYAFSIRGIMLFAEGHLSKSECFQLDQLANEFAEDCSPAEEPATQYERFLLLAKSKLNIKLKPLPIKYVFRLN